MISAVPLNPQPLPPGIGPLDERTAWVNQQADTAEIDKLNEREAY